MNINNFNEILENSRTLSDLARTIFGKRNYTNIEKCKKILLENNIDWQEWLKEKKIKPKKYCLYCGKEIIDGDYRKKFCNQSCAASYNNMGKVKNYKGGKHKLKYCLNCGKELMQYQKNYCCNECRTEGKYKEYIRLWKLGKKDGMSGPSSISRLIRKYLFKKYDNKCQMCGWGEENPHTHSIPLQIHHIDGDCTNNKEENLQLLCPNCHSLTETFGGRNENSKRVDRRTKYFKEEVKIDKTKNIEDVVRCVVCGKKLKNGQITFCSHKCMNKYNAKNITKKQILDIFQDNEKISYEKASKLLGISTTSLKKKCEKFGILSKIRKIRFGE